MQVLCKPRGTSDNSAVLCVVYEWRGRSRHSAKTSAMDAESRMRIFCHYKVGCVRTYHLIATIFILIAVLIMLLEASKKDYRVGQSFGKLI